MSDKPIHYPADRKYTSTHEWAKPEGGVVVIGISDYAQHQLGDVVFVELPSAGATIEAGQAFGVIESVKAASDLFAPLSGTVQASNAQLVDAPETVNQDALGAGWLLRVQPSHPAELDQLLDADTYRKKIESGEIH